MFIFWRHCCVFSLFAQRVLVGLSWVGSQKCPKNPASLSEGKQCFISHSVQIPQKCVFLITVFNFTQCVTNLFLKFGKFNTDVVIKSFIWKENFLCEKAALAGKLFTNYVKRPDSRDQRETKFYARGQISREINFCPIYLGALSKEKTGFFGNFF